MSLTSAFRNMMFILAGGIIFILAGCTSNASQEMSPAKKADFVGSNTCLSCHATEYADWTKSDHFKALQLANDTTVLGDFDNAVFEADGVTTRFYREGSKFYIQTHGDDGAPQDFEVTHTFGYYPLQQYLVAFPGGRMQATRVSWDARENKWFQQYAGQEIDSEDWLHWTNASQNWNTMCASCHSTQLEKNYDEASNTFNTTWKEINVSCESCHGPGSLHVEYMQSDAYKKGVPLENSGFRYASDTTNVIQLNACASCHARKSDISRDLIHSDEIMDNLIPQVLSNEFYFPDGQIMEEDYVYGSFVQSKMFHYNVRCTNCHNPHSGKVKAEGNALCLNCHAPLYDTPKHHFHEADSEGAQCVNCHMTTRTYMGNDHRRDHSLRVPRPDQSVQYNTPNACHNCHEDQSNQWASDQIVEWYGSERKYHFSDDLLPGSLLNENSEPHLVKLLSDKTQPGIARATAAYYLGQLPTMGSLSGLVNVLSDSLAMVRYQAIRALENFPPELWIHKAASALEDPVRAVRIAAADLYHRLPPEMIPTGAQEVYVKADQENIDFLHYQADFSVGNVMIADYELQEGNYDNAIHYYLRGLRMDSLMNYARLNLATVYSITGRNNLALQTLKEAAAIDPVNERIYYNLGLLQYEMNDTEAALQSFQKAVDLKSFNPSVYYNYGLLLQQQSQLKKAEEMYLISHRLDPQGININYALALFYLDQQNKQEAEKYGKILKAMDPGNPDFEALFQALEL